MCVLLICVCLIAPASFKCTTGEVVGWEGFFFKKNISTLLQNTGGVKSRWDRRKKETFENLLGIM